MDLGTASKILGIEGDHNKREIEHAYERINTICHMHSDSLEITFALEHLLEIAKEAKDTLMGIQRCEPEYDAGVIAVTLNKLYEGNPDIGVDDGSLAAFPKAFGISERFVIAIFGVNFHIQWETSIFGGRPKDEIGCSLRLAIGNLTDSQIQFISGPGNGVLIDDLGNQYSSLDSTIYWEAHGGWHQHGGHIASSAKMDGFILYPPLRDGAAFFDRWEASIWTIEQSTCSTFSISLPRDIQISAIAESQKPPSFIEPVEEDTEYDEDD